MSATQPERDPELMFRMTRHFLATLAHELRTPLVPIRGYTKLVLEGGAGELNETQRGHLSVVLELANQMVALTQVLTSLSTFETLHPEALDPRVLIDHWTRTGEMLDPPRRVIVAGPQNSSPVVIAGDRAALKQAMDKIFLGMLAGAAPDDELGIDCSVSDGGKQLVFRFSWNGTGETDDSPSQNTVRNDNSSGRAFELETAEESLSEARDVIRLHGGQIAWSLSASGRFDVVLNLPVIDESHTDS